MSSGSAIPQGSRCLIVGVNSFLGRAIAGILYERNDVTGVYHQHTDLLRSDIHNTSLDQLMEGESAYDHIFLVSAYVPGVGEKVNEALLTEVNAGLAEQISRKFPGSRLIYASTVSVYGKGGCYRENSPVEPLTPYARSKFLGEEVVRKHGSFAIVRISSMYGEDMKINTFLPLIVRNALKDGRIVLKGDGGRRQNYVHVNDVAEIFGLCAAHASNNTYLAVGKGSYSNREIADLIKSVLPGVGVHFEGTDASDSFEYDSSYTLKQLVPRAGKKIEQGIAELVKWMQSKKS